MMFLSEKDIENLTHYKRHDAQMEALNKMGIISVQRPDGTLAVLEAHVKKRFGGYSNIEVPHVPEPNWNEVNA